MDKFLQFIKYGIIKNPNNRHDIARTSRLAYHLAIGSSEFEIQNSMFENIDLVSDLAPFFSLCGGCEDMVDLGCASNCYDALIIITGLEHNNIHQSASTLVDRLNSDNIPGYIIFRLLRRGKWKAWITSYCRFENLLDSRENIQPFNLNNNSSLDTNPARESYIDAMQFVMISRRILEIIQNEDYHKTEINSDFESNE